ncbi:hypothetical protein SteCoe_13428 [Stentor coeruleus]|uniref:Potassium channel domain-containing protein n=1 Tax=Stentor coeruleus TaxID=5963 RepID=A0A1R2C8D9_9CILI|nr:hypothetical protein SteCoe_13428 [Stentor coeruleus]
MKGTIEAEQNTTYSEVINELRRKGTQKQDGLKLKKIFNYRKWLKVIDTLAAGLTISNLANQYYLTQMLYYNIPQYTISTEYNNFCYLGLIFTSLLLICILMHHIIKYKVTNIKKANLETEGFKQSSISITLEIIICSITSLPNVNIKFTGTIHNENYFYHITDIFMIIMLLKCYILLRLYEHYSKWTSLKAYAICKNYLTTADAFFGLKSDLKDRPFLTIGFTMGFFVVIFGIATQQSEKCYEGKSSGIDKLTNSEWLIIMTMTTVGYGDFYPITHLGRFFCLLACISGMVLISALVVSFNMASEFSRDQSIAYLAITTKNRENQWFGTAANVIKAAFKMAKHKDFFTRYKSNIYLRKCVFNFKRKTEINALMDITSAEMLYDIQHKLEEKLLATNSIICSVPDLRKRCESLKSNQNILNQRIQEVLLQYKTIHIKYDIGLK